MNASIQKELHYIYESGKFNLGEFIYMGMGMVENHKVCLAVAYKIDYCIKKARQFEAVDQNVKFTHVNKVKVGELKKCEKFLIENDFILN